MSCVLAIDTALGGCSVAFRSGDGACVHETAAMERGHAEALMPMVRRVMEQAGAPFSAIDLIVTTVGPGAFTGLRIGMAAALGLGVALERPVCGVTTTEILAAMFFERQALPAGKRLCVLTETKRSDFHCQFFGADGAAEGDVAALDGAAIQAALESGGEALFIGDAAARFCKMGGQAVPGFELPDPLVIAEVGFSQFRSGRMRPAVPLYLRGADVSVSKQPRRTIQADSNSEFL